MTGAVTSNRRATPTTRLLTIETSGTPLVFRAGQWVNLGLSPDTLKPYSIASAPGERPLEFLIREDGSGLELSRARRGVRVFLEGPRGSFTLSDDLRDEDGIVFVAGGTGIAPIRSIVNDVLQNARARRRRCALVYSARNDQEFAFLREFRRLSREGLISLSLIATRSARARWKGLSGRLTATVLQALVVNSNPIAYVCGPEGFVKDVRAALDEMGVKTIRTEEQ